MERINSSGITAPPGTDFDPAVITANCQSEPGVQAYFADPEDLIPDATPVLGYVDDAIMIDLVAAGVPSVDSLEGDLPDEDLVVKTVVDRDAAPSDWGSDWR